MNSFSTPPEPGPSHGDLLADRLTRLDVDVRDQPVQAQAHHHTTSPPPKTPHDGYGFRPLSGMSSPRIPPDRNSPLPDVNGLGWPGQLTFSSHPLRPPASAYPVFLLQIQQAKSTLSRLNASPEEKKSRETRLTAAVRTVLECIGEDPDREGLLRTPERYAQALMWMTKGYEERLAGMSSFAFYPYSHNPSLPHPLFTYPRVSPHPIPLFPQKQKAER